MYETQSDLNRKFENTTYANGDRVKCEVGTATFTGTICGIANRHIVDFYIVRLDGKPFPYYPYDCIVITESCLKGLS